MNRKCDCRGWKTHFLKVLWCEDPAETIGDLSIEFCPWCGEKLNVPLSDVLGIPVPSYRKFLETNIEPGENVKIIESNSVDFKGLLGKPVTLLGYYFFGLLGGREHNRGDVHFIVSYKKQKFLVKDPIVMRPGSNLSFGAKLGYIQRKSGMMDLPVRIILRVTRKGKAKWELAGEDEDT